jgi:hypothetical protein
MFGAGGHSSSMTCYEIADVVGFSSKDGSGRVSSTEGRGVRSREPLEQLLEATHIEAVQHRKTNSDITSSMFSHWSCSDAFAESHSRIVLRGS